MKNKRSPVFLLHILLILGMISCEKSGTNCITKAGRIIFEKRTVAYFDSIDVGDYVNLFLTQDSVNSVTVESGQNIVDGISTEVTDRTLVIRNNNQCNWLRSYDVPVNVHISVSNLAKIFYYSSGNIKTVNQIVSDNLSVVVWGGCGIIDLNVKLQNGSFAIVMGTADIKLHGHCSINSIVSGDFGLFDARDLTTGYTYIKNEGSNDCYVRATQYMEATIGSIGNIYYFGRPDTLVTYINGSGKVISL